jgi:hypothetical protein
MHFTLVDDQISWKVELKQCTQMNDCNYLVPYNDLQIANPSIAEAVRAGTQVVLDEVRTDNDPHARRPILVGTGRLSRRCHCDGKEGSLLLDRLYLPGQLGQILNGDAPSSSNF